MTCDISAGLKGVSFIDEANNTSMAKVWRIQRATLGKEEVEITLVVSESAG